MIPTLGIGKGIKHLGDVLPDLSAQQYVSENLVVSACIQWLYNHGLKPIRNNTGAFRKDYVTKNGVTKKQYVRFGQKGTGDILFCTATGKWAEIECKSTDGKQSPEQKEREAYVRSLGGLYILARSVDDLEAHRNLILGGKHVDRI